MLLHSRSLYRCVGPIVRRVYSLWFVSLIFPASSCRLPSPSTQTTTTAKKTTSTAAVTRVELGGRDSVSLECDWGVGIGGSVWSTGLLLAEHLSEHAALYDGVFRGKRILELGSGTGLVGEEFEKRLLCGKGTYVYRACGSSTINPAIQRKHATCNTLRFPLSCCTGRAQRAAVYLCIATTNGPCPLNS